MQKFCMVSVFRFTQSQAGHTPAVAWILSLFTYYAPLNYLGIKDLDRAVEKDSYVFKITWKE